MTPEIAGAPETKGPKPIAVTVSTSDVHALFMCDTSPDAYNQLILAKLKDAECPAVEGLARLKLTHGQVYKLKDSVFQEQVEFTYLWLPSAYVASMSPEMQRGNWA